jgi:hypothetical protein
MHRTCGAAFAIAVVIAPDGAVAQQGAVHQACEPQIEQYCAGVVAGDGRLRTCVQEHFSEFSEPCRRALLSSVTVVKACKEDVQKTCAGIEPGGGRIQACMKDHFAEYSQECQRAIITAKFGAR